MRGSTRRIGDQNVAFDELDVRIDAEVRFVGVPLGLEQIERVLARSHEAEGRRDGVEVDRSRQHRMRSAEVERKLAVDEDPQVVVARKTEALAAQVEELG